MKQYGPQVFLFVLLVAAAITLACGSPMTPPANCAATGTNTTGDLEAISLCPAQADAGSYPGGVVPFVAIGHFTTSPSDAAPIKPAVWGACSQNAPTTEVLISSSGSASCVQGASGTYTIFASDPTNCNVIGRCGAGCQITGTAKLTCP
jgi:hypothetical protein